ncbi:MAG: helix-turn-helix transcriptional regulator [Ruminococcaceae bacterium]|nr:helix-turn-helix transcriptional regulator [Oscillospiraceae bacterium]
MEIKETVKANLIRLRREHKLTQLELSEKINYSDKAVSRWETGEVTPDVETLAHLATLYGIPITAFFLAPEEQLSKKEKKAQKRAEKNYKRTQKRQAKKSASVATAPSRKPKDPARARRAALLVFSLCFLWTLALSLFFILHTSGLKGAWYTFIWAVPATFVCLLFYFNARHAVTRRVFSSLFVWTALVATYLQTANWALFPLLFLGIPLQAIILLFPFLKKKNS